MKKFLLLIAVAAIATIGFAQENPCPTVGGIRKTNVVNNGNGTCTGTITLHITNDVSNSNPKGVQVRVLNGTTVLSTDCFIASTIVGGGDFTTSSFTTACSAALTIEVTRFTASNGNCQGGTCGQVLIIQESPLPVSLVGFEAKRNHSNVNLSWDTETEMDNSGFAIERKRGNGGWEQVAFVPSQASNGNSIGKLHYTYSDLNATRGITEYRLKQVDLNGKTQFSDIRPVRGDGQTGKTIIYPNPSLDGKVKVMFEDASAVRDVILTDLAGRVIKQWKGVTNNNLQIDNLTPGFFTLKIMIPETGEESVEKIVVRNR